MKGRKTAVGLCIAWNRAFSRVRGIGCTFTVVFISPRLHSSCTSAILKTFWVQYNATLDIHLFWGFPCTCSAYTMRLHLSHAKTKNRHLMHLTYSLMLQEGILYYDIQGWLPVWRSEASTQDLPPTATIYTVGQDIACLDEKTCQQRFTSLCTSSSAFLWNSWDISMLPHKAMATVAMHLMAWIHRGVFIRASTRAASAAALAASAAFTPEMYQILQPKYL